MQSIPIRTVLDEITDFLATEPSPQAIIAYQLPNELQARADFLAERNSEDQLTASEHEALDEFLKVERMFSLLKSKMKLKVKKQSA
jgi:hypothetical protein